MNKPEIPQVVPYVLDMEPGTYYWCACGKSQSQPFCDGSHTGGDFAPLEVVVETKKAIAWCGCKHSQKQPFCDGMHKRIP